VDPGPTAVLAPPEALSRPGRLDALRRLPEAAGRVLRHAEFWLVLVLAGLTFVVHDVPYVLRWPFWTDEAWVAVTTRFPLSQLPAVTSSTPIGWSLLLRLFTVGGQQWLRLLPLCFAALTVAVAYVFGRGLGWRDRRLGVLAGRSPPRPRLMSPADAGPQRPEAVHGGRLPRPRGARGLSRLERDWSADASRSSPRCAPAACSSATRRSSSAWPRSARSRWFSCCAGPGGACWRRRPRAWPRARGWASYTWSSTPEPWCPD